MNNHKKALVTGGSLALGAVVTRTLLRSRLPGQLVPVEFQEPTLDANVGSMEMMEGSARYYFRAGTGRPIVLAHSVGLASASFEMAPIFEHLTSTTNRPVYAIDWMGYGLSDRPPIRYGISLYHRQIRRFLSEIVGRPADVIAHSNASEFIAAVAVSFPRLVHRLVLISPTGLSQKQPPGVLQKTGLLLLHRAGLFEVVYYRMVQRSALQRFYQRFIFRNSVPPPLNLVNHAFETAHVEGAHHAPRYFVRGALSMHASAYDQYNQLKGPTLLVIPHTRSEGMQGFERSMDLIASNPGFIQIRDLDAGLMPQWEIGSEIFDVIDGFIEEKAG